MPAYFNPKIGDLVWFKRAPGGKSEIGQLRDIKLPGKIAVIHSLHRESHRVPIRLVEAKDMLSASGPIGDGSVSWEEWQELDDSMKEQRAYPMGSGK